MLESFIEIFTKPFYGNTIGEWALSLAIMLGSVVVAKIAYWIFSNIFKRLAAETETNLDDIIIDMVEEPLAMGIAIVGIWYGFHTLNLPDDVRRWIGHAYYILIIFNVAWLITRLFDSLVEEYIVPLVEKTETDLDDQLLPMFRKGFKVTIWAMAIVIGLNNAGYDVGALLAGLGIGGLAFALAAQDTVANFFGGITIVADKPFKVDDWIIFNDELCKVEEIGVRSTQIRSISGRVLTVPNRTMIGDPIENVSSEPSRRVDIRFFLALDTKHEDVNKALEILKQIPKDSQNTEDRTVACLERFTGEGMVIYYAFFVKKGINHFVISSEINLEVVRRFGEAQIQMAYPGNKVYHNSQMPDSLFPETSHRF